MLPHVIITLFNIALSVVCCNILKYVAHFFNVTGKGQNFVDLFVLCDLSEGVRRKYFCARSL